MREFMRECWVVMAWAAFVVAALCGLIRWGAG